MISLLVLALSALTPASTPNVAYHNQAEVSQAYDRGDFAVCASMQKAMNDLVQWPTPAMTYEYARCLAKAGRPAEALTALQAAVEHPIWPYSKLTLDQDFVELHDLPEWPLLLQRSSRPKAQAVMGSGVDNAYKRRHPPRFPDDAPRGRSKYTVVLIVFVSPDDNPAAILIETSSGVPVYDRAAVIAASRWRYQAAHADGVKFGFPVRIPVDFIP